ncbi:unnamed protein product [Urochloa humidicola]
MYSQQLGCMVGIGGQFGLEDRAWAGRPSIEEAAWVTASHRASIAFGSPCCRGMAIHHSFITIISKYGADFGALDNDGRHFSVMMLFTLRMNPRCSQQMEMKGAELTKW